MWSCLEHRIQCRIPPRHLMLAWMVESAAALRTHLVKGEDGNTANQSLRGRPLIGKLMTFGEYCRYKAISKEVTDPVDHGVRYNMGIAFWDWTGKQVSISFMIQLTGHFDLRERHSWSEHGEMQR